MMLAKQLGFHVLVFSSFESLWRNRVPLEVDSGGGTGVAGAVSCHQSRWPAGLVSGLGLGRFLVRELVCGICPPCSPPLLNPSGVNRYLLLGAGPGSDLGIAHANLVDCVGVARLGLIWAGGSLSMRVGLELWKPAYQAAGGDLGAEQVWGRRTMTLDGFFFKMWCALEWKSADCIL